MRRFLRFRFALCLMFAAAARADSIFPLGQNHIPAGTNLPLPYGCGVSWYRQEQDYALEQLTFAVPGGFPPVGALSAENTSSYSQLRPNLRLLPFLEVYGILGRVRSDTVVRNVPLLSQVTANSRGTVYGGGATLVGGRGDWFASLSVDAAYADMNQVDSSLRTIAVEPHIGRNFRSAALWVGAMYQDTEEKASGTFALPGLGAVPYSVTLKAADAWNYQAGGQWRFNPHLSLVGQAGFGQRRSLYLSLEFAW